MYKKVIIPLDTSQTAERVLPYVRQISTPGQSRLVLVNSIEPQNYAYAAIADEPRVHEQLLSTAKQNASDYLIQLQNKLVCEGYAVTIHLSEGDATQFILDISFKENADLIAMTTHGRSGIMRWVLGSVADRVVRTAYQPVLLVNSKMDAPDDVQMQRILVPLDGSKLAEQALTQAKMIAKGTGASIQLLRVVEPLAHWEQQLLRNIDESLEKSAAQRAEEAREYLAMIRRRLEASQIPVTVQVYEGAAADSILDAAENAEIDLIVMSTHGYGGYTRWVYGSVANQVLHRTACPLLLNRAIQEEDVSADFVQANVAILSNA